MIHLHDINMVYTLSIYTMNGHLWPDAMNVCFTEPGQESSRIAAIPLESQYISFSALWLGLDTKNIQEPSPQCKADSVGLSFQGRPWVKNMPLDLCKTPWNMQKICEEVRAGEGAGNGLETCQCAVYLLNTYHLI